MADGTSDETPEFAVRPGYWLWPVRLSPRTARSLLAVATTLAERLGPWPVWIMLGAVIGAGPLLVGYLTGLPGQQAASALLLMPIMVAAISRDWTGRGLGTVGSAFFAHCALAIMLSVRSPLPERPLLPDGLDYWQQSKAWIETGTSPEYELGYWLPVHGQLVFSVAGLSYLSLGMSTFWGGFYQVDLMNYYVSQLVVHSRSPWIALTLGWHPWSQLRGIGYLLITFEMASWSLSRLTGTSLSTRRIRLTRWTAGLVFVMLDCLVKYCFLDTVRQTLAANLL